MPSSTENTIVPFLNSRYKDFYDIYVLSKKYSFSYQDLYCAIVETFTNRKTSMTMNAAAFSDEFINDTLHQTRWKSFLKKKNALVPIPMNDALHRIKIFVEPLLNGVENTYISWDPDEGIWK